jgi:hypothetical protein
VGLTGLSIAAQGQSTNEMVLPIVVNGPVAERMHYQTIFTILNASKQEISATLQIHNSAGTPAGVFCSPLAPPPSSVTIALNPNAQYFQFTSADLPFLIGWAHLRWEGPASILASVEITQVAAAPARCLLVCNRPSTEKLASAQISALKPGKEFHLPLTINRNRQTALALVNPSATESLNVNVSLLDTSGDNADLGVPNSFGITLRPLEQIADFVWQMAMAHSPPGAVVGVPETFQGSVILTADTPFAVGALNIMFPEDKFVAVPVISPLP